MNERSILKLIKLYLDFHHESLLKIGQKMKFKAVQKSNLSVHEDHSLIYFKNCFPIKGFYRVLI